MEEEELSFEVVFQDFQDQISYWQQQYSCKITFDSSSYRSASFWQTILQSYELLSVRREGQEFEEVYSQIIASIQTANADQYEGYSQLERTYFGEQILLHQQKVVSQQIKQESIHQEKKPGKYNDEGMEIQVDGQKTCTQNYQADQESNQSFQEHTAILSTMLQ